MDTKLLSIDQNFMIPRVVEWLEKASVSAVLILSLSLVAIIGSLDWVTGITVTMAPFYLIPIGLIALRWDRKAALLMSILAGVVFVSLDTRYSDGISLWPDVWNIMMRVGVFVLFGLVVSRVKWDVMKELKLNADLQSALAEVKQLSGLLPICAWCKRIRDEGGNWEPIESYVSVHSEADFTHGICPDCARRYHPSAQQQGS